MDTASIQTSNNKKIAIWLIVVAALIYCMIVLGGLTRLTHSGLSMVDWKPIMGIVPPLTLEQWQTTFEKYQQFPEYRLVNQDMPLGEFKRIFYFEYFHRILGRLIGLAFLLPFLYFWIRGMINKSLIPKIFVLFILGGLQGLLGWYMVKSGLVDNPMVSQYRLTAHLMAAVLIYAFMLWIAFGLLIGRVSEDSARTLKSWVFPATALVLLIALMIASGGFVAGTRAGLIYNTFPLMAGKLVPDGMYTLQPFWMNWFENAAAIQFNHRLIAYMLVLLIPVFCIKFLNSVRTKSVRSTALVLVIVLGFQVALGITTLVLSVPIAIAAVHQAMAIILLTVSLLLTRQLSVKSRE